MDLGLPPYIDLFNGLEVRGRLVALLQWPAGGFLDHGDLGS